MSLLSKLLDKLGMHKERSTTIGTTTVAQPDPPTAPSDINLTQAAKPAGPAPVSDLDFKDNKHRIGKEAKD